MHTRLQLWVGRGGMGAKGVSWRLLQCLPGRTGGAVEWADGWVAGVGVPDGSQQLGLGLNARRAAPGAAPRRGAARPPAAAAGGGGGAPQVRGVMAASGVG